MGSDVSGMIYFVCVRVCAGPVMCSFFGARQDGVEQGMPAFHSSLLLPQFPLPLSYCLFLGKEGAVHGPSLF